MEPIMEATRVSFSYEEEAESPLVLDGISLTVAKVGETEFQVSVIPHTGEETALLKKKPGDVVNLENDIVGKYVERLLGPTWPNAKKETGITMDFLREYGI